MMLGLEKRGKASDKEDQGPRIKVVEGFSAVDEMDHLRLCYKRSHSKGRYAGERVEVRMRIQSEWVIYTIILENYELCQHVSNSKFKKRTWTATLTCLLLQSNKCVGMGIH